MFRPIHHITTVIRSISDEDSKIKLFELADPDDWDLPPFTAGAHVSVHSETGLVRQYSLCGSPYESNRYRIAIQREDGGRGGSVQLHQLQVGQPLYLSLPRNLFPLAENAKHHVMIAGGIGITPFLAMLSELRNSKGSYELHYCTRSETAFIHHLLARYPRGAVKIYSRNFRASAARLDVRELLRAADDSKHVYCCGSESLLNDVIDASSHWKPSNVHYERFGRGPTDTNEASYRLQLARSGRTIEVRGGQTMLDALREAEVDIDASCEAGVCLLCKTRYLEGTPKHRDVMLKELERREFVTPCVSGCDGAILVLDL